MEKLRYIFVFSFLLLFGCEDPVPTDYIPQYYVEAFLIVDQPIDLIRIQRTQPINDTFKLSNALVKDAVVKILVDEKELLLNYRDTGNIDFRGYYYFDTSYKVEPNKIYKLEVITADGKKITGVTQTPERFQWTKLPPDTLIFPTDTINFKDKQPVKIKWTPVTNMFYYFVVSHCLDTLEYGKYLNPPLELKNRRIYRPNPNIDADVTNWDAIPNTEYQIFWLLFKWYGKHKIYVYAPDFNYLRWVLQHFRGSQINPLLSSVDGAIGVFGSASRISSNIFLKMY
ncbi:MAG: DUF4249 family protein [Candidatus Kapaibacteriales bacterium]